MMSKLIVSIAINAILLAGIGYLLLKNNTKPQPAVKNCNEVCMNYNNSTSSYPLIDGALLRQMANNYRPSQQIMNNNYTRRINSTNPLLDARAVWFDLEDLKRFIWEIESRVCNNACTKITASDLGIRIYFARYPGTGIYAGNNTLLSNLPDEYEGMHTVFMVPTYNLPVDHNIHIDFNLDRDFDKASCLPAPIPDGFAGAVRALIAPLGKNHGTLCPPACSRLAF